MHVRAPWLLLLLLVPALAFGAQDKIQASMVVTGTITVNADGSVKSYTLRDAQKLPPSVQQIIARTVPHWEFLPVMADGKAIVAEVGMSLRVVGDQTDANHMLIRVAGANFGCSAGAAGALSPGLCPPEDTVSYLTRKPPRYPMEALQARVGGEVFLAVEVGRDGHVLQAAAKQVDLYTRTDDPAWYRAALSDASVRAARKWQFRVPTEGPASTRDHWVVMVPVNFIIAGFGMPRLIEYGHWNAYLPGPEQDIPWAEPKHGATGAAGDATALAGSAPFLPDPRFVLKTPLGDSAAGS